MLDFIIVILILLAVSYKDIKEIVKAGQRKLIAFYAVTFGISLTLAALHCFGFRFGGV